MNQVLEFPSKIFVKWGAIAQEIVPYLAQRGAKREEIHAVIDRIRIRWEQRQPPGQDTGVESLDQYRPAEVLAGPAERAIHDSRHWRSQPARTLIEAALDDYQRHCRR